MLLVLSWSLVLCCHIFSVHCVVVHYQIASFIQMCLTSKMLQKVKVKLTSAFFVCVCVFSVFCFPGILTMSTPWMTGAQPSVGCKCRSYNSWSCRYCLSVCFGPNIYVSSSPDTSSVSAEPLPVRLISAMGSLVEEGAEWNNFVHLQVISH